MAITALADRQAVIHALSAGKVIGVAALLQRAAPNDDLALRVPLARAARAQILSGAMAARPYGRSVRLSLTRQGRSDAQALRPVRRGNYPLLRLAMVGAAALISAGCSTTLELPRGPLMGFPAPAGVQQIRDAAGRAVYEPFNPCAGPTAKTPVLGGYQSLDEARARPAPAAPKIIALGTLHLTRPMPTAAAPPFAAPIAQPLTLAVPLPALPVSASPAVTTLFAFSSARLTPQAKAAIRDFASRAKSAPAVYARGFTDAQGSAVANEVLARNRAAVVRAELIAHGVPPDKIKTSYCTTCFCSDNGTAAGRQANRRVDIGLDRPTT